MAVKVKVSVNTPVVRINVGAGEEPVNVRPVEGFLVWISKENITSALGFEPIGEITDEDIIDALGYTPLEELSKDDLIKILGCTPLGNSGGRFASVNTSYSSPSSAGRVAFHNGAKAAEGAGIWLYGNDCDGEGKFRLQVYNVDTSIYWAFDGLPNGDLKWGGGFLNPPMVASTEYKTTERYQGKVVYAKLINAGALPNQSSKTVSIGASTPNIVSFEAMVENGTYTVKLPYIDVNGDVRAFFYVKNGNGTFITFEDLSAYNAKVLVKYTK